MEHRLIKMTDALPLGLGERLPRKGEFSAWDKRMAAEVAEGKARELFETVDHTFDHPLAYQEEKVESTIDWLEKPSLPSAPKPDWWNADCRFTLPYHPMADKRVVRDAALACWQENDKALRRVSERWIFSLVRTESLRLVRLMPHLQGANIWALYMDEVWSVSGEATTYQRMVGCLDNVNAAWPTTFADWAELTWQRHSYLSWKHHTKTRKNWQAGIVN